MKQRILEALKAKFPGGNANVLNRIADKLCKTATTDEQVTTAVAGVTKEYIEIIESYGDSRATESQQTAVQNYESKYGLKDGQKIDNGGAAGGQADSGTTVVTQPSAGDNDLSAQITAAVNAAVKPLNDEIVALKTGRVTETRKQQLSSIIEKLPENLRKAYERTPVDGLTDEQFSTLVREITSEVDGIANDRQAKGAVFGRPSALNGGSSNQGSELTKEQMDAISHRDNKPVDGQPF